MEHFGYIQQRGVHDEVDGRKGRPRHDETTITGVAAVDRSGCRIRDYRALLLSRAVADGETQEAGAVTAGAGGSVRQRRHTIHKGVSNGHYG